MLAQAFKAAARMLAQALKERAVLVDPATKQSGIIYKYRHAGAPGDEEEDGTPEGVEKDEEGQVYRFRCAGHTDPTYLT